MAVKAAVLALPKAKPMFTKTIKTVPIGDLKPALHNPKSRTDFKAVRLRQLRANIEEIGLIYPIAVGKDMTIIEGHRRWDCCKSLGWDEVPVLIIANENANAVYAGVNANSETMDGCQVLQVWLKEPEAVSRTANKNITRLQEIFGRQMLNRLVKEKMSYRIFDTAIRISRYTEDSSKEFLMQAADWLLENRNNRLAKQYITLKQSPKVLWNMVRNNKPLTLKFG